MINEDYEYATLAEQIYILEESVREEIEFWNYYHNLEGHAESEKFNIMKEEGIINTKKYETETINK